MAPLAAALAFGLWLAPIASPPPESPPARLPPEYTLVGAEDLSQGDFFRARFRVRVAAETSRESAEAVARDIVERRIKRRVLHVAEVRIQSGQAAEDDPPAALVLWAERGDPAIKPRPPFGDYSRHTYTVWLGEQAARSPLVLPLPAGAGPAPAPAVATIAAVPGSIATVPGVLGAGAPAPPLAGIASGDRPALGRAEVLTVLHGWRAAWEARDLESYLAYYDESFRSGAMDLVGWRRHKAKVFARAGEVRVGMEDLEVSLDGEEAEIRFRQVYRSGTLSDVGSKSLRLRKRAGAYRIVQETWSAR